MDSGAPKESAGDLYAAIAGQEAMIYNRPSEATAALLALRARAVQERDLHAEAYALMLLGGAAIFQGDYVATVEYAQPCVALTERLRLRPLQARALNALGVAFHRLGQTQEAIDHFGRSLELALEEDDEASRGRVLINMAGIYVDLEDYPKALELYQEGQEIALNCGAQGYATDALRGTIEALELMGRDDEALALVPEALRRGRQYNMSRVIGDVLFTQGKMLLNRARLDEARHAADTALAAALSSQDSEKEADVRWLIGEIELARDHHQEALEALAESERISQGIGHRVFEARAKGSRATLYERLGNHQQAVRMLREQREIEQSIRSRQVLHRAQTMAEYVKLEVLRREAEIERQRSEELEIANSILQQTQVELTQLATHDNLTGVVNRTSFWNRAQRLLELMEEGGQAMALIFADIDHLKSVNDRFGHAAGDYLILTLAQRLRHTVRAGDIVARLSGDEFMILLTGLAHPEDIDVVTQKLLHAVRQPVEFQGQVINPSMSLGAVIAPLDGANLELLHKHADLAMYHAKSQGRNTAVRFQAHMSATEQERRQLEQDLRTALETGGLELHYQGQYLLPTRKLYGFEALVRWNHPKLGMLPPIKFIPLAEESHLIVDLGVWVLQEACRQASEWNFAGRGMAMSVNVSARQFEQENFVQTVRDALGQRLPGECLVLELTESMVHHNSGAAAQIINELRSIGVRVAMDDFGTGYSSLSMLKNLPFRQLKIDRSFLQDLTRGSKHFATAHHFLEIIVGLAHHLNMRVIAEGVETEEQLRLLCAMGCDKAQGYHLARPCPAPQAREMLGT